MATPAPSRDKVAALWKEKCTAALPLADAKAVSEVWGDATAPNWAALLATFPKSMKGRVSGLKNATEKGTLAA